MSGRYDKLWEPRVGAEAAGIIRRRGWVALSALLALLAIVVFAVTLRGSLYYALTIPFVAVFLVAWVYAQHRLNRALATALTRQLGLSVSTHTLPPVRSVEQYDAWLRNLRDGTPLRQRSFFGGFIRFTLPPK